MVIGILSLLGGCFVLYQAYSLWVVQSMLGIYLKVAAAFLFCGLDMIVSGAVSIENDRRRNPNRALSCAIGSLFTAMVCAAFIKTDLAIWFAINIGFAGAHFFTWHQMKEERAEDKERLESEGKERAARKTAGDPIDAFFFDSDVDGDDWATSKLEKVLIYIFIVFVILGLAGGIFFSFFM